MKTIEVSEASGTTLDWNEHTEIDVCREALAAPKPTLEHEPWDGPAISSTSIVEPQPPNLEESCPRSPVGEHSESWFANNNCEYCNSGGQPDAPLYYASQSTPFDANSKSVDATKALDQIYECIYDHGNGKTMGVASIEQRRQAYLNLAKLHKELPTPAKLTPSELADRIERGERWAAAPQHQSHDIALQELTTLIRHHTEPDAFQEIRSALNIFAANIAAQPAPPPQRQPLTEKEINTQFESWAKTHIAQNPEDWPLLNGNDSEEHFARMAWVSAMASPQRQPLSDWQIDALLMRYGYDADDEHMREMIKEAYASGETK